MSKSFKNSAKCILSNVQLPATDTKEFSPAIGASDILIILNPKQQIKIGKNAIRDIKGRAVKLANQFLNKFLIIELQLT